MKQVDQLVLTYILENIRFVNCNLTNMYEGPIYRLTAKSLVTGREISFIYDFNDRENVAYLEQLEKAGLRTYHLFSTVDSADESQKMSRRQSILVKIAKSEESKTIVEMDLTNFGAKESIETVTCVGTK